MKQKTITTDKATLLVVELPEGAYYPNICQLPPIIGVNYFLYENGVNTPYKEPLDIPKGNWQLLGRLPEITEGQFEKIVEFVDQEPGNDKYILKWKDYEVANVGEECPYVDYSLDTATESFYSLLQANEVYFENPIPPFKERLGDWQEAQSKVWDKDRTFLFIKVY